MSLSDRLLDDIEFSYWESQIAPKLKLNIGCGKDIRQGYVNIDKFPGDGVDIVLDLDSKRPILHYGSNTVDEIYCSHCLEHMYYWHELMREFGRVLKVGGRLIIKVPKGYDPSAFHVRFFERYSMDAFLFDMSEGQMETSLEFDRRFGLISRKITGVPFAWHINKVLRTKYHSPWLEWELEKVR